MIAGCANGQYWRIVLYANLDGEGVEFLLADGLTQAEAEMPEWVKTVHHTAAEIYREEGAVLVGWERLAETTSTPGEIDGDPPMGDWQYHADAQLSAFRLETAEAERIAAAKQREAREEAARLAA